MIVDEPSNTSYVVVPLQDGRDTFSSQYVWARKVSRQRIICLLVLSLLVALLILIWWVCFSGQRYWYEDAYYRRSSNAGDWCNMLTSLPSNWSVSNYPNFLQTKGNKAFMNALYLIKVFNLDYSIQ